MFQKTLGILTIFFAWGQASLANGIPTTWQIGMQEPVTPVAKVIVSFFDQVTLLSTFIMVFVLIVLLITIFKFRETKNLIPSTRSHNPVLEVAWTIIPVIVLTIMTIPSLKLIYFMDKVEDPELTLKIVGSQWYWNYEIPELDIVFESRMIPDDEIKPGQLRLLEVDEPVVLPINTKIRILVTASDVLHSWTVPAFGVKKDATPGRIGEAWIEIQKEGVYYGQCSELCGMDHGFMPIKVQAVSKEEFLKWADNARHRF